MMSSTSKPTLWRTLAFSAAAFILLLPLIAMQFTDSVVWTASDFVVAGVLLFGPIVAFDLASRRSGSANYKAGVGFALAAVVLLTWINGAVGIIGNEDNPLNLMYGGVTLVALVGALVARFQARGLRWAMACAALAQVVAALVALSAGYFTLVLDGFFVLVWLASSELFRRAAAEPGEDS